MRVRPVIGAIVLAGGRGSRLGGADKAALTLGGEALLAVALRSVGGLATVVAGPRRPGVDARFVREDPPFGGPAAAVVAGLAALPDVDEVLLLAVDVPGLPRAVPLLRSAATGRDGVAAVDPDGRTQWLLGRYRTAALRAAVDGGEWTGRPLRALLGGLDIARLPLPADVLRDVDTVTDARAAGVRLPGEEAPVADDTDAALDEWWTTLSQALGLERVPADRDAILGLAGEAAHAVVRPAAPLTTFLAGYAAGRAGGSADDVAAAIERARAAARSSDR